MWPPAALEFLRDLEDNNDRDWFRANRHRYDNDLLAPARRLAESLTHLGQPHFFRPYNNLRFHPGPPLKEQLGVAIGYGAAGGFYFQLSLDGLLVAAQTTVLGIFLVVVLAAGFAAVGALWYFMVYRPSRGNSDPEK